MRYPPGPRLIASARVSAPKRPAEGRRSHAASRAVGRFGALMMNAVLPSVGTRTASRPLTGCVPTGQVLSQRAVLAQTRRECCSDEHQFNTWGEVSSLLQCWASRSAARTRRLCTACGRAVCGRMSSTWIRVSATHRLVHKAVDDAQPTRASGFFSALTLDLSNPESWCSLAFVTRTARCVSLVISAGSAISKAVSWRIGSRVRHTPIFVRWTLLRDRGDPKIVH